MKFGQQKKDVAKLILNQFVKEAPFVLKVGLQLEQSLQVLFQAAITSTEQATLFADSQQTLWLIRELKVIRRENHVLDDQLTILLECCMAKLGRENHVLGDQLTFSNAVWRNLGCLPPGFTFMPVTRKALSA